VIRILDVIFSLLALLLLSPILLITSLILRFTGEGEIFYRQVRVGLNEQKFELIKFATMQKNSPQIGAGTITVENDPRVLPFGRYLRKSKVNELPQLVNVLVGDMSLIGPRPLTEGHYYFYSASVRNGIKSVKPGLSGVGSIIFRDEERLIGQQKHHHCYYKTFIAPHKGELELWFARNQSVKLYFLCILLTLFVVFLPSRRIGQRLLKGTPVPEGKLKIDLQNLF
jgi:lipopolysaccharide/colanic/teichoic acid biosynthesis glycosyltransferase